MASEIHGDLAAIHDEDLLRRMWQQTEDFGLKKEIRTHMYKLREARLRDFYTTGDMDSSGFGPTKTPLTPSHGDSLADQSFQSFKTKEIRDSESPTHELKFTRSGVIVPDTSGWNVVTSSEVSPDGKAYKTESIATTEGIQHIPGGRAEFAGKNEHLTKVSHQGDDRNYVKTAGESSATHLEEKSVTGDERSGRVEKKSTTTTSSSHVSSSKFSSTEGDPIPFDHQNIENEFEQLVDSTRSTNKTRSGTVRDHQQQQKQHQQIQNERYRIDGSTNQDQLSTNRNDENLITKHDSRNIQQEVDFLAAQPGKLISRTVDYPDPNTKVITETKSLPDGTTVTTRRYETKSASSKSFRSSSNQQQSTTSRTVVEDRAQRNRVEYIKDNVIDQVQQPTNQVNRTIRNDHTNETVQRTNRTENVTNKQFLDRKDSTQSIDTVDRSTTRRENLKDQVENVMLDSMHRTVKKDLSQKYRNQEFIDTERDYQSRPSNMPEYQQPIRPSQNTSAVRTEHIETFREIDTDHKSSVVKEPQQPQPAAGKPSYNTQQPSSRPSPSKDQQRSPPSSGRPSPAKDQHPQYAAGKPSYSPQPSTPIHRTSDQHPTQPGYERQIPIDTSGYPRGKSPDDQCPEFDRPTQQPDYVPRTDDRQPTTRAAGKPSYTPQQPVGKPPNTQPDTGTDRPYQQPGHVRDIPIDREPIYSDRPQHRPVREQDLPTEKPYQSDTTTTTRETRIHRTDRPDDHQPGYYNSRPSGPQPQQSGVREIPVDRSDDYEPRHPAGKPSVTPQKPSDSQPQSYQSPRQEQPEYVNTTPIERQPDRTAGKPSYNRQPERPSTTTEVREEYNEYSDIRRKDITQGYPSDRPQQPGRSYPRESPTRHGYEPSRPVERSSPGDRTYPRESPTRPLSDRPQYSRRPSEESRVSTDSSRYANKKISVEVNPTHDAFARSLRCVSPSDRGSVRSLRTSTTSIRSSKSPEKRKPHDKRTHRSPSRDSITYSESSRISSSTVTKGRTDTTKDIRRTQPKTPTAVSPKSQPSKVRPETHRSNETIDLTTRKGTKHHITTITKEIDEYPGENGSPSKPSSVKPTTRTASIQNDRKPKKTTTTTTVTSVTQKSPIKEPVDRMIPQKSRPETIDKTDQTITIELIDEIKPKFKKPTPGSTTTSTVIDDKRSTQKTTTTKKSPEPTKTFPENKKTHPSTPEVSRSPYSSPERSTRPEQPNREPLYDTPKSLKKVDTLPSPYPTPEKPVDTATTKPKFTKTVRVDNAIIRGDKPTSRGPKKPNGRHPTSDDEGFEPESPRSSSPTSSVSDLVYQKNPEDHQPEVTTVTSTSTRRDTINREFIDRERENIEKNKTKKTTMTVDDSTFERRKQRKESPQHIDRPRQDSPEPFDVEYPRRESPERFSPRRDTEDNREYSPERSGPRRHPSELTRPRLDSPIRGSPERFTPRQESPERHYSRENSPEPDSLNPKEPREPFYLIEPRKPGDIDEPKKPEDIKKPKTHPQLTRSETYEERCRQILGMDPKETTDEMVRKSISPQRDTIDFITTERITEERTYKPMPTEPTPSPRSTSPRKLLPDDDAEIMRRSKAPTRETSPTKRSESPRETTVCYVETEISTRRLPYDQSPEDSPRRRSPESSPSRKPKTRDVPRRGSPESSPSRKPTTRDAPRRASPESSPSRKPTTRDAPRRASPESSPSKKPTTRDAPRRASPESSPSRKPSTRDAPRRVSPESSPSRKPSTRDVPRRESPESSPSRKPTTRDAPCRTSPESSPSRKPITRDSPRMTSPASSPSRKPAVKDSPRRGSPDSSPSRKPTTRDSSVKRSPETSPSRKPSTRTPSVKESPATSPIRKTSIRECPRQLSPATSPSRKPSSRNAPRQQSPSPVRKSSKKTVPRAISPQTSPDRKTLARDSPQTSSPVRNTSARDSPQTTPVRKPSARDSPQNSSFKKPSDKDTPFMRSPDTSPLRKPSSRAEPHRRSPDSSPVRKSYPRHEPRKHSPDTSSIQRESPHRQSPGTSPARKPSTRDAPRRRSPEPTPSRKPYGDTRDLKEKTYRKSPSSSPTRKHPAESPEGRSPHTSPTRSSPTCRKPVQPSSISPSHHEPSMTTETVTTVVTKKLVRDSPISKSPRHTEQSPERPNHVTTAKIHLSPTLGRKSSSPDMKKSTKSPQTKPTSDVRTSSVVTSTREDTPRTSKSTVPQSTLKQPIEKFTTDKRTTTEIRRGEDKTYVQRKHREEKVTDVEEDEDSDVVSDSEDIETVIETTTVRTTTGKKHPGKKQPVTERKESAPVFRTTAKVDKDKMTRSTSDNLIRTTTRRSKPEIDAPTGPKESPRKKSIDKKRPVKCMTTKTINLTTTNNIINSEDMENVIIDIQQAKSSREPSPNRLVPTPVHHDEYTGSPRYPDTVDEPEDEVRRKPKVNDIPIFEEDTQDYVRCHISEVEDLKETIERKTSRLHRQSDEETTTSVTTIKKNSRETSPIKDRPRYSQSPERDDDEYRLSVHDKVSKFITTAEEVQKPKPSAPFQRDTRPENFTEPDDCLLSVNAKVNKFLTTAESVTKPIQATDSPSKRPQRPSVDEIDEELRTDECILSVSEKVNKFITTAEKLAATTPQKSPQLVAKIERQVSRKGQSSDENDKEYEKEPEAPKRTPKTSVTDRYNPTRPKQGEKPAVSKPVVLKSTEAVKKAKSVFENGGATKPKQRDILSRPSVWEGQREPDVKLQDIGVYKPFDDETEEIINRERSRSRSPGEDEEIPENCPKTIKISTTLSDSVSSKKNLFENRISTSTVKTKTTKQNSQDIISRTPTRRPIGNISSPSSAPTNRQPVEKTKPSEREPTVGKRPQERDQPQEYSPTKRPQKPLSTRNPKDNEPDDVEYIEDYSSETTTTTRRTERRSPSRHCEYSPTGRPENYSPTRYAGGMPDDYSSERDVPRRTGDSPTIRASRRPDESTTQPKARRPDDSPSRKAPERPKDFSIRGTPRTPDGKVAPTTRSTTQVERTQTTKSSTTRRPDDYSPARTPSSTRTAPQTPSKSTPRRLFDGKDNSPARHELAPQISNESRPSYMEPTVSSLEHRRESLEPITHSRHDLAPQTSSESRPSYMEPTVSSLEHRRESLEPITHSRQELASPLPIGSRPSYMEPTVSSIEHRRDSLDISKTHSRRTSHDSLHSIEPRDGNPRSGIKFGVELKRMDSRENKVRRKSSSSDIPHVEEIYDLELLEKMLETVVGYEHRRRIRSQIRIVKKMIEDQIHHKTITTRTVTTKKFGESPSGKPETYVSRPTEMSPDRRPSSTRKTTNDSRSHSNQFIETESRHITRHEGKHVTRERSISPRGKVRTVTTTTTEVRKAGEKPITKKSGPQQPEDKPIWATKNILKKPSDNDRTVVKRTTTTKTQKQRMITKDDEDCITSSYGIGPTDEDGKPLFGIRALKKKSQQPGETTKVTGSVVTESYYSENGAPPVGERKVTVYSTNPDDVDDYETLIDKKQRSDILTRERSSKDGMTSVTRIQKIGNRKDAEVVELPAITDVKPATTSTKQSKIVRKGSVKEMSEKFTRKESSSSITEKTGSSSYPKAGLILRTQTHTSSEYDDPTDECDIEIRTTRKQSRTQTVTESDSETESRRVSKTTKSFLNSGGSKVTGVDDVLDRMRNADNVVEDGDTIEDQEARSLLNKFLGASVLMSGMESMMPKEVVTRTIVESPGKHELKTTRVTKTIKTEGSSSPVARKTCDIEEIWDVEYLKELLEKSTNYEERRRIRARIRQLMAEKEACADIVASVTAELLKEQQRTTTTKSVTKNTKAAIEVEEAAVTEESETESEYEEVEIVEEVTDDSSAEEAEEVEEEEEEDNENDEDDNDDDDEEKVKTDKDENPVENSKKTVVITKTVETKIAPEKAIETVEETIVEETTVETSKVDKEQENEEQEQAEAKEQSESLLLPLLQGLLHKNKLPTRNQTNNQSSNTNPSNNSGSSGNNLESNHSSDVTKVSVDNEKMASKKLGNAGLAVHHVEDSGTESGEDLKLIAAGLRDSLQMHSISDNPDENGLISEVTTALNRLELSLREGKDLKLDAKKRNALLTLVARLQTGLISPEKITAPTPAPGQTADGDTELSSPEGDNRKGARPGHQRFAKRRNRANRHTVGVSREELADARRYIEEMVMMESISNCTTPDSSNLVTPPDYPYTIQKQNSAGAVLGNDVQEPSTLFRPNQFVPDHLKEGKQDMVKSSMPIQMRENKSKPTLLRQSISIEQNPANSNEISKRPYSEAYPRDKKVDLHLKIEEPVNRSVYEKNLHNSTNHSTRPAWGSVFNGMRPSAYQPAETSPLTPSTPTDGGKSNRFINKKMMMKRANTIDIPKPMKYMNEMESDSDGEDRGVTSIKAIGLRGTVQVTVKNTPRNVVPQFKPKTENDLKFLAFIQKQTPNSGLAWNNPSRGQTGNMVNNWSNKFGNIKNNFESGAISTSGKPPMPSSSSSARNFWKKTEVSAPSLPKQSPKVPSSPKTYDRTTKPAWNDVFAPESPKIFVPKPIAVNKFSHAPMSAFQPISPIPPNTEPTQFQPIPSQRNPLPHMNDSYSEPISVYSDSPTKAVPYLPIKVNRSPILPWAGKNAAGNRVHSLAASKFESKPQRHESVRVQDQTYQQRVSGYNRLEHKRPSLPSNTPYDANLQAPQMVQNIMHDAIMKEFPPLPYTSTDYTQPSTISTYIPEVCITRSDSLTNPEAEPIVLTSDRPFISPYDPSESLTSPNYTQNEVSDSDFDTDSVTEYKAESKIMRGPVSQQAVTVGNRTMRRGDEGKFGKNSKEAKSLLSFMKNVKPTDTAITSDGRSYQAPKVGSVLPTTDEVNRFTHEIIPVPQYQTNIVQGYNPIYQQPKDPKPIAGLPYQTPSPQIPVRNTPPMYQSQQSNYAVAPEYLPNINGQGYHPEPMQNNHPQPARTNYEEPPRTDYPDYPPRTTYQEPQRVAYQEPPRTNYQEHPRPLMSNYQEPPLRNYQEPSRTTYPESPRSTQSYSAPQYDIPPYQEKQRSSNTYSTSNYQEVPHPETPKTLKTYPSYQEQPAPRKLKDKDVAMIQQNFTKITSAPTTPEKRTEPFASKTPNGSSSNPTTPKDESVPKLKKYGPPQLHSYRPNSYQYPLSEVPRKFSEPTVRTSSHTTITRDMARTTTLATKFIAPHIIETPSSPLALDLSTTETTETKEKDGAVVTTTTKVITRTIAAAPKPVSPFAKFRQLDKQNSQNSPITPTSPMTPGGTNRGAPLFQFTDPALCARAATVKDQLLQWCQMKTKEYENVQITNFSTSWSDGLAFCALIHHFLPDTFDYSKLTPQQRRHNFELAFRVADEKAGIAPLLDVEDMVVMRKPDWKCVFTYVQTIYRRFRNSS